MTEIKINKETSNKRKYYYEFLELQTQRRTILEKGFAKTTTYFYLIEYIITTLLVAIFLFGIMCYEGFTNYYMILFVLVLIFHFLSIVKAVSFNRTVNRLMQAKFQRSILVDKDTLTSRIKDNSEISVFWKEIAFIYITKYVFAFIMKDPSIPLIGVPVEYKDEMLHTIQKEKVNIMIQDH